MDVLSRYTFISTYNTEQMTRQEAVSIGVSAVDFTKCDTDGDGIVTIEEILANDDVCREILEAIKSQQSEAFNMQEPPEEIADDNPEIAREAVPADEKDKPFAGFFEDFAPDMPDRQFDFAA